MRRQRHDFDVHEREQRQAGQRLVEFVARVDVEDRDVGVFPDDPPQVRPWPSGDMVASIATDTAYVSGSRSAKPGEKRRPAVRRTISSRPSARTWAARVRQNFSEYCAAAQAITAA